jgi:KTSC domain
MALLQGGLSSSCLSSYEYDTTTGLLILTFVKSPRGPYYYYNVPQPVFKGLMSAKSKGTFFNANIWGVYE